MKLDTFKPTIVYVIYIAAAPDDVWRALTTAEFSRHYSQRMGIVIPG
jgi:uncharacterized protein YndB with AHSA1/START domain